MLKFAQVLFDLIALKLLLKILRFYVSLQFKNVITCKNYYYSVEEKPFFVILTICKRNFEIVF